MKKIRLHLEALDVQSFVTAGSAGERGTVQGADSVVVGPPQQSQPPQCWIETGRCLGTRYDDICDTSFCVSRDCPIETADSCIDTAQCITLPPNC